MTCKNCGNEIKENEKFCAKCGTAVPVNNSVNLINKNARKKVIISVAVTFVVLIGAIITVANSGNNEKSQIDSDNYYNDFYDDDNFDDYYEADDYVQPEDIIEESLADSCEYVLLTGYDDDGSCYQLVGEDFEDYQGSQIHIGIIKNNEWLVEMTSESPFIDDYNCIYGALSLYNDYILEGYRTLKGAISNSDFYNRLGYVGKGCFYLLGSERYTSGYLVEEQLKTIVFWNGEANSSKVLNNVIMTGMENYVQGNEIIVSELTDHVFALSESAYATYDVKSFNPKTFETKALFSQKRTVKDNLIQDVKQIGDGLFYCNGSFYSTDGSKAFDLEIKNIYKIDNFKDGQCEIITQINTGSKYRIIIDKSGNVISDEKISD